MRRVLAIVAVLGCAATLAFVASGAGGSSAGYQVRAIFDNAGFVIPGEDVKVSGVKVGSVDSLDVTKQNKAAVVLDITDPGFQDFRRDASCRIRPQGLIGERFVDCEVTQTHAVGQAPAPRLKRITRGTGAGQYLLPVANTSSPVDIDLIGDVMRQPVRDRLSLILNELGTGVAGRGADLNAVIRRADPALQEVDKLLAMLAKQNHTLEDLAVQSDTVLAPLARDRAHVGAAIRHTNTVAAATASRRGALAQNIQKLPAFLTQLRPTMQRIGALSDEMTPTLRDLNAVAPSVNRLIMQLGPFSQAAIPAVNSLGAAAKVGTPAMIAARPVITDLRRLANVTKPVGITLAKVLESFQKTRGIERLLDYTFYQVTAINGFDSIGHYLRAGLIVNQCSNYSTHPVSGCSANFSNASSASASAASAAGPHDKILERTALALAKALNHQVQQAKAGGASKGKHAKAGGSSSKQGGSGPSATPSPSASSTPGVPTPAVPAPAPTSTPPPSQSKANALLDYLFGKDGG